MIPMVSKTSRCTDFCTSSRQAVDGSTVGEKERKLTKNKYPSRTLPAPGSTNSKDAASLIFQSQKLSSRPKFLLGAVLPRFAVCELLPPGGPDRSSGLWAFWSSCLLKTTLMR